MTAGFEIIPEIITGLFTSVNFEDGKTLFRSSQTIALRIFDLPALLYPIIGVKSLRGTVKFLHEQKFSIDICSKYMISQLS